MMAVRQVYRLDCGRRWKKSVATFFDSGVKKAYEDEGWQGEAGGNKKPILLRYRLDILVECGSSSISS